MRGDGKITKNSRSENGNKRKLSFQDTKVGVMQLKQGIEELPQVKHVLYSGELERVNKQWVGPGFYFPSGFIMNGHVPLYLVGGNNRGYGERANIIPKYRTDKLLDELIGFRLDGYGSGAVSKDESTLRLVDDLENMNEVNRIETAGIERRTEKWDGPGFYNIKSYRKTGQITLLSCGSKKIGAGLRVYAFASPHNIAGLEFTLRNYSKEGQETKRSERMIPIPASQYGNAIHL